MIQWRADSPHVGETSADMFFSQEELSVCNMFSSCVVDDISFNKC